MRRVLLALVAVVAASPAGAFSAGAFGRSGESAASSCRSCHGSLSPAPTATVTDTTGVALDALTLVEGTSVDLLLTVDAIVESVLDKRINRRILNFHILIFPLEMPALVDDFALRLLSVTPNADALQIAYIVSALWGCARVF